MSADQKMSSTSYDELQCFVHAALRATPNGQAGTSRRILRIGLQGGSGDDPMSGAERRLSAILKDVPPGGVDGWRGVEGDCSR